MSPRESLEDRRKREQDIVPLDQNEVIQYDHPDYDLNIVMDDVLNEEPDESFCFLNEGKLRETMRLIRFHFLPENQHRKIIYAIKANPKKRILKILLEEGIDGFDCASRNEIAQVLAQDPKAEIFFNNPINPPSAIKYAVEKGVRYFTVQNRAEIEKILTRTGSGHTAPDHKEDQALPEISIRLQTLNEHAKINLSTKYGATEADTKKLLKALNGQNSKAAHAGLSIHTGSQNASAKTFERGIELMTAIAREVGGVSSINVGGGIPVNYHPDENYDVVEYLKRISKAVRDNLKDVMLKNPSLEPKIILELGRAIIAPAVDLAIPILAVEKRGGKKCLYMNDGVFTSFSDATIHDWRYHFKTIGKRRRKLSSSREPYVLFGRTCDSGDVLGELELPEDLKAGDYLWVRNAGAYLDSQSSLFNGFEPPKYVSYNQTTVESVPFDVDLKPAKPMTDHASAPSTDTLTKEPLRSEVLSSKELTPETIREISDFFRLIFNNDWPEFVVCLPCDSTLPKGMKLSAPEVYETNGESVPISIMDTLPKIPDCPNCSKKMQLFHDPKKTFQRLKERLTKGGYVSLLRDRETDKIEGFAYGYGCTLKNQFESEWGNRYNYMADPHPDYDRSFEKISQLSKHNLSR